MLSQTRSSAMGTGDGHYRFCSFWRRCMRCWHVRRPADFVVGGRSYRFGGSARGTWRGSSARRNAVIRS